MKWFFQSLVLVLASAGYAANVSITASVDLLTLPVGTTQPSLGVQSIYSSIGAPEVTLSDGDIVSVTYLFLPGQMLTLADLSGSNDSEFVSTWLVGGPPFGAFQLSDVRMTLLNASALGGALSDLYAPTKGGGWGILAPFFNDFIPEGGSISFTGITSTFQIVSGPGVSGTYSPWLVVAAERTSASRVSDLGSSAGMFGVVVAALAMVMARRARPSVICK